MINDSNLFRIVLDTIDVVAWAIDKDGTILLSEGKQLRNVGLKPGQIVGLNVFDIYKDNPGIVQNMRRALAGEEFVAPIQNEGRTFENRYSSVRDENGEVVGAAGVSIDVTDEIQAKRELERRTAVLTEQAELLDLAWDAIMVRRFDGAITYYNDGAVRLYGYSREEAIGRSSHELFKTVFPVDRGVLEAELTANNHWSGELTHTRRDGTLVIVASRWFLKRDARGEPSSVLEINTDITARKREEEAQNRQREELIRAQKLAIAELSTPLIPITDEILVMPLIGVMDSNRAKQVMESLLNGLSASRGKFAIIDITGVAVVDTQVANALLRAANAARLLGSQVLLTGIRPEVAQTLASLDADLSAITTKGTLQSGIAYALEHLSQRAHGAGKSRL